MKGGDRVPADIRILSSSVFKVCIMQEVHNTEKLAIFGSIDLI